MFRRMREIAAQLPLAELLHSEIEPGKATYDDDDILRAGMVYGGSA